MTNEDAARRKIGKSRFTASSVVRTDIGYSLKFRQGVLDIVRTGIDERTLEKPGLDVLLDQVRSAFHHLKHFFEIRAD